MIEPALEIRQGGAKYPLFIGSHLLEELSKIGDGVATGLIPAIVVASRVDDLYHQRIVSSFEKDVPFFRFEDGEPQKTMENVTELVGRMLSAKLRRDSLVYLIGGGVLGDAAGFAASIYLRGIRFIHVPTTLLSQVDSSIGGKLGVNHPLGKNLIGTFAAPEAVVSDVSVIESLTRADMLSGLYEALKSGVIGDHVLFEIVANCSTLLVFEKPYIEELVRRAATVKASIVGRDEREAGDRRLLNYGHTIGHAIETVANFQGISHGEAVAWGMLAANEIAARRSMIPGGVRAAIDESILRLNPTRPPRLDREALLNAIDYDKKFVGSSRVMVLPEEIGRCSCVNVDGHELERGVDFLIDLLRQL